MQGTAGVADQVYLSAGGVYGAPSVRDSVTAHIHGGVQVAVLEDDDSRIRAAVGRRELCVAVAGEVDLTLIDVEGDAVAGDDAVTGDYQALALEEV